MADIVPQADAQHEDRLSRGAGNAVRVDGEWLVCVDLDDDTCFNISCRDLFAAVRCSNRELEDMAWRALGGR